jgi:hypothetical protein
MHTKSDMLDPPRSGAVELPTRRPELAPPTLPLTPPLHCICSIHTYLVEA